MEKRWSKTELTHLKRYVNSQTAEELAQRFHTDVDTVRRKIEELHLGDGAPGSSAESDEELRLFEEALKLIFSKEWEKAAKIFEQLESSADHSQLVDRARQFLAVCRERIGGDKFDTEPYLQAVFEKNQGKFADALEICKKHGSSEEERFVYLEASLHALDGAEEEALKLLTEAIRLDPKNRVHAYHDPDFQNLRGTEEFSSLLASSS